MNDSNTKALMVDQKYDNKAESISELRKGEGCFYTNTNDVLIARPSGENKYVIVKYDKGTKTEEVLLENVDDKYLQISPDGNCFLHRVLQ